MSFLLLSLTLISFLRIIKCQSQTFSLISQGSSHPVSIFSTAAFYETKNEVLLYGGSNSRISIIFSDFHSFNLDSLTWNKIISKSTLTPPALYSSISFVYLDKFYLLFGMNEDKISSDFYSFDFTTEKWSTEYYSGDKIQATIKSAFVLFEFGGKSYLAIHGGVTAKGSIEDLYMY